MLGRLLGLFKKRGGVRVPGADQLAEGEARTVDIGDPFAGGKQVLLCRVAGRVYGLETECPHEGGRLAKGPLADGKYAVCPLHNYRFDPRDGSAVGVTCRSARTVRVEERDGELELFLR
jgi:nitrite reductase/ring-hydroxylating ferredoxin subunit